MKKIALFSMTLLLLAACGNEEKAEPESTDSNVAVETNIEAEPTAPVAPEVAPKTDTALAGIIDAIRDWSSYQSLTTVKEVYENSDNPESEMNMEKQYVAEPAQVYMFTSSIGFSNSQLEQYASYEYVDGGFESMDGGEFYDLDTEAVNILLKNSLPSRAELLTTALSNATHTSETNGTFELTLDNATLEDLFNRLQATLFYHSSIAELDASVVETLSMGSTFHSGTAKIVTDGSALVSYELAFDLTSEFNGASTYTFTETFDQVNSIELIEGPEELAIGIGVN